LVYNHPAGADSPDPSISAPSWGRYPARRCSASWWTWATPTRSDGCSSPPWAR